MEKINQIIGENLKKARYDRELSLDKTSNLTGVSKAMLGQIERGESNPTVATLWKITNGLEITFSSLMKQKSPSVNLIKKNDIEPIEESQFKIYPIVPFDNEKQFEIHLLTLEPGGIHESEAHNEGVEEYLIVNEGTVEIEVNGTIYEVNTDDTIIFSGNRPHRYKNTGKKSAKCLVIIYYSA